MMNIVIDFEKNVNYAQALIYKKMLEHRLKLDPNDTEIAVEKQEKKGSPF
jgi:hypothetical protein